MLTILPRSALEVIHGTYLRDFKLGFCGTPVVIDQTLIVIQSKPNEIPDVKCFCDEKHFGTACEYGVCPENQGLICSGHGHPDFGFGVERNASIQVRDDCIPVCAPGTRWCKGRCDALCDASDQICPLDRPYRCANKACVAALPKHCATGHEQGFWDNLQTIPVSISCALGEVSEACYGANGGPVSLPSPLLALDLTLDGNGTLQLTFSLQTTTLQAPGSFHVDFAPSSGYGTKLQTMSQVSHHSTESLLRLVPHPLVDAETYRLEKPGESATYIVQRVRSELVYDNSSSFAIQLLDQQNVLALSGSSLPLEVCFSSPWLCVWKWPEMVSPQLDLFLCSELFVSSVPGCTPPSSFVLRVQPTLIAFIAKQIWHVWNPTEALWNVQIPIEPTNLLYISGNATILSIKYLLLSDITTECVCLPYETSQTTYNSRYLDQSTRSLVQKELDKGLGVVLDAFGRTSLVRGVVVSLNPVKLEDSISREIVSPMGNVVRLTKREFSMGQTECDLTEYPTRCRDGSCSSISLVSVDDVTDTCVCVLDKDGSRCSCRDSFGVESTRVLESNLHESCFWAKQHQAVPIAGFKNNNNNTWISLDSHSIPIWFLLGSCNNTIAVNSLSLQEEDCLLGKKKVRAIHSLSGFQDRWIAFSVNPFSALFFDHLGGMSVLSEGMPNSIFTASSNSHLAAFARDTSSEFWASSSRDHDAFISVAFATPMRLIWVYCEFETVAFAAGGIVFPVTVYIQATISETPSNEDWVTLGQIPALKVINGSSTHSVLLHSETAYSSLRLHSYFPLAVRSFIPFTDQNCSTGRLSGVAPDIQSSIQTWLNEPPSVDPACVCDDSCVFAKDSACSDQLFYNLSGVVSQEGMCATGTDCTDCGTSLRLVNPAKVCGSPQISSLLESLATTPLAAISNTWTIGEFVSNGARLDFNLTKYNQTRMRWIKPQCLLECPFHTCLDGSCAHSSWACAETRFTCKGDGCVRANIQLREYKCACEQGWSGSLCNIHECTPGDPFKGIIDPHKWCTCNGPSPLKIKPPYQLVWGGSKGTFFTSTDILALNRPLGRNGPTDVGWVNIFADKAPFESRTNADCSSNWTSVSPNEIWMRQTGSWNGRIWGMDKGSPGNSKPSMMMRRFAVPPVIVLRLSGIVLR